MMLAAALPNVIRVLYLPIAAMMRFEFTSTPQVFFTISRIM
jgi:hypothetical protein